MSVQDTPGDGTERAAKPRRLRKGSPEALAAAAARPPRVEPEEPEPLTGAHWLRRTMRTGPYLGESDEHGIEVRSVVPSVWHLESNRAWAVGHHSFQGWCGVQLGKYRPERERTNSTEVLPEGSVCPTCLSALAKDQPRAWGRR